MESYSDKQNIELVKRDQLRLSNFADLESTCIDYSPKNTILVKSKKDNKESLLDKICNFLLYLMFSVIYYIFAGYIYYCILFGIGILMENSDSIVKLYICLNPVSMCFFIGALVFTLVLLLLVSIYYYCVGKYS